MIIQSEPKIVQKSAQEFYTFASKPENHKNLMPSDLSFFESDEKGYTFQLNGMPKVALKVKETIPNSKVIYTSAKDSLQFDLTVNINEIDEETCRVDLVFEGSFNPFIKMMVEKPLNNFIQNLSNNIEKI